MPARRFSLALLIIPPSLCLFSPCQSYPSWLSPQMSQVLGTINSMYPTAARRAADRLAAERARAFRDAVGVTEQEERLVSTGQFESFLERHLQDVRTHRWEARGGGRGTGPAVSAAGGGGTDTHLRWLESASFVFACVRPGSDRNDWRS